MSEFTRMTIEVDCPNEMLEEADRKTERGEKEFIGVILIG